jgi:hypothetical protein
MECYEGASAPSRLSLTWVIDMAKTKKVLSAEAKAARKAAKKARRAAAKAAGAAKAATSQAITGHGVYKLPKNRQRMNALKSGNTKGHGGYAEDIGNFAGKAIGKGIDWVSDKALGWISTLFGGNGDYAANEAPERNSLLGGSIPRISNGGKGGPGSLIYSHQEMIANVQSSSGFQISSYQINPGLPQSFPWLNGMGGMFQRWRLRGMIVIFKSLVNAYGGADVNGPVLLSTRYDTNTPAPVSIEEAANSEFAVMGNPMKDIWMAIECDPKSVMFNNLKIRETGVPAGDTQQAYDHCIVDVMNSGQADASITIGQIWVSYEVELDLPIDVNLTNGAVTCDHFQLSTVSTTNPLGSTRTATTTSTLGGSCSGTTYTFPSWVTAGEWFLVLTHAASTTIAANPTANVGVNCTRLTVFSSGSGPDLWNNQGAWNTAGNSAITLLLISVTAPAPTVVFSLASGSALYGDLFVMPFNGNMVTMKRAARRFGAFYQAEADRRQREEKMMDDKIRAWESKLAQSMAWSHDPTYPFPDTVSPNLDSLRRPPAALKEEKRADPPDEYTVYLDDIGLYVDGLLRLKEKVKDELDGACNGMNSVRYEVGRGTNPTDMSEPLRKARRPMDLLSMCAGKWKSDLVRFCMRVKKSFPDGPLPGLKAKIDHVHEIFDDVNGLIDATLLQFDETEIWLRKQRDDDSLVDVSQPE